MAYANTGTVFAAPLAEREARPSLFSRMLVALTESRQRKAQRHINAHAHLFRDMGFRDFGVPGCEQPRETMRPDGKLPFGG